MVKKSNIHNLLFLTLGNQRVYLLSVSSKGCGFMFREVRLCVKRLGLESCILTIERPLRVIRSILALSKTRSLSWAMLWMTDIQLIAATKTNEKEKDMLSTVFLLFKRLHFVGCQKKNIKKNGQMDDIDGKEKVQLRARCKQMQKNIRDNDN
jgi:hypothetical protein